MIKRLGIIGAGHLAEALVEGWLAACRGMEIMASDINPERLQVMRERFGLCAAADNQELVERCEVLLLAVLPTQAADVCRNLHFRVGQTLISVAAGCRLESLAPLCAPAQTVRALPITSASIGLSPTQIFPDNATARELFGAIGSVHVLETEDSFTPATVIGAFYGWLFALAEKTIQWAQQGGVAESVGRPLVLETMRAMAEMGLQHPQSGLDGLLEKLATPGGITRHGLAVLEQKGGLQAWEEALEAVRQKLEVSG